MQKRYVYILLTGECEIIATETSLKKIWDAHEEELRLLSRAYISQLLSKKKDSGEQLHFKGKDGRKYRLAARRIQ